MFTVAKKKKTRNTQKVLQPTIHKDKSKPRSVSVTKSKQNIRLKTKPDLDADESRTRNKAFISVNAEVDTSVKHNYQSVCEIEPRRRRTPIPGKNKINSSHSQLLKAQLPRRRQVYSAMQNKRKSKDKLKTRKTKLSVQQSIYKKPKLQINIDDLTHLQYGNANHLMSVTSSGDIVFSSHLQSKHSQHKNYKNSYPIVDNSSQFIAKNTQNTKYTFQVDPNALLRIHLKKQYKKKIIAVIKIQKIWRGYKTRKLLDKVITDMIHNYHTSSNNNIQHSYSQQQHLQNFNSIQQSNKKSNQNLSFNTAKISSDYHQQQISDCSQIKSNTNQVLDNHAVIHSNQSIDQHITAKQTLQPAPISNIQYQPQSQELEDYNHDQSDFEDEQEVDIHLYRHQKAIYSYEDIHEYLQESQKRQCVEEHEQDDEEDFYDEDNCFQPEIIIETNEQYLDSRKNSVHTKKTKTIESRKESKEKDEALEVRKFSKEEWQLQHRKRSKQLETKQQQQVGQIRSQGPISQFNPKQEAPINNHTQKDNYINVLDKVDNQSTKSHYKQEVIRLKRQEIQKWTTMIELIKANMKGNKDAEMETFLMQIIQQSQDNKKWLEGQLPKDSETMETRLTTHEEDIPYRPRFVFEDSKPQQVVSIKESSVEVPRQQDVSQLPNSKTIFRKKHLELNIENIECTFKKQPAHQMVHPIKSRSDESPISKQIEINWNLELQTSNKATTNKKSIKQILEQKMVDLSTTNLNDIISVRQQMLKERKELQEYKLRRLLEEKKIDMTQFQQKINSLLEYVESEKAYIEMSRKDIIRGLQVAVQVAAKTQRDARMLGRSAGLSRSAEQLIKAPQFRIPHDLPERLIVDEIPQRMRQKNFFCDDSASSSSEGSFINEEELKRYRDPKFGSPELCDMNKNIMTEEFLKSQKTESYKNKKQLLPKKLQDDAPSVSLRSESSVIIDALIQKLMLECAFDMFKEPCIKQTAYRKLGMTANRPKPITRLQIFQFIDLVEKKMPSKELLLPRINQQLSPPPLQLLRCMRVDQQFDEQDLSQEELSKYEFVIPQSSCTEAIREMQHARTLVEAASKHTILPINFAEIDDNIKNYIENNEKIWKRRSQDLKDRRSEVFNNQMHCIFDCWNEQITDLKSSLPGFSGIGLNETTLSLKDHNFKVALQEIPQYVLKARQKLLDIVMDDSDVIQKIEYMSREQICESEGDWICYTDETLGLVLELDYMISDKLIEEVVRFLSRTMKKGQLIER